MEVTYIGFLWFDSIRVSIGSGPIGDLHIELGLLYIIREGNEPEFGAVATSSHIDAIPYSGKYDGVVGVLGLYTGSNGYLATEVIQIRKLFGPWHEAGDKKDVSEPELCEYVEVVNLTGDFDVPSG
ncbi:hypothetical protein POM88_001408 [Heracleum sosnowskyi]|uniref:Uncharacterized protein n=1 Tax=Heracleum sosnowskyi TaxID=360622 RepID=A0AAD8JEU3_9APIA|nr:hypothetical protein POM88_001408 [Heracleum sosnowskyi]